MLTWIVLALTPAADLDVPDPRDGGIYHCTSIEQVAAVKAMIAGRGKTTVTAPLPLAGDQGDLAEVNAQRAQRGLRPYQFDPGLTQAAQAAANFRASRGIEGHCNDFSFLPPGTHAAAAGCAAWQPGTGFGACAMYENWTYAGAGSAIGRDGRRYMHLFVR